MSNKAAEGLIIKNLSMLEAVMTAFHTKIGPEICGEICKLIEEWAKEQIFDGKYDLYEEEYFWFAPESWKYRNEQDKEEWIARYDFVLFEDGKEINFVNWFNPRNKEHIQAFRHLKNTGMWPKDFIPENVKMDAYWHMRLVDKLANYWVDNFSLIASVL